ncbi:MAG TPA: CerR family C-terminal domain-containing protein [Tepidisphaeraceae bacterium]|nr:CerR family C-terminal domain-containing protein [Tepidisphaeraceae bacterium]
MEDDILNDTRQRLLDAAGEVFADRGFEQATVREICRKAGANVAAVNYHFGNKRKLYTAVFDYSQTWADNRIDLPAATDAPAEDRLREFVRQFLRRLLDPGRPSWHDRLMAREMSEPTEALKTLVDDEIRPRLTVLQEIVRELAGEIPPRVVAKCAASVVGQMLHYHFARPVLKLVSPIFADLEEHVEELADHVTRFSLSGISAMSDRYRKDRL